MKKTILIMMLGILALPYLGDSYAWGKPRVTKWRGNIIAFPKDVYNDSTVVIGYDKLSNTITLGFNKTSSDVEVMIYKNGSLIVNDNDQTDKESTINYTIDDDTEDGTYSVYVKTDGKEQIIESVEFE